MEICSISYKNAYVIEHFYLSPTCLLKQLDNLGYGERGHKVAEAESELKKLRTKAFNFPNESEKVVKEAKTALDEKLTIQFNFEKELTIKQTSGELALKQLIKIRNT
ncbi:MAG: hypothetical protein KAI29_12105 [Cyclobacteriaceae bacterium]|nr:hypothetical protein [Cyclobacteriaceae bacterium]